MRTFHRLRAFTLIELLVVIAIIAILAAILFPVFAKAREKARQSSCASNQKQIGMGIMQYVQDYDEVLPWGLLPLGTMPAPTRSWNIAIEPYLKSKAIFVCPSKATGNWAQDNGGYACNHNLMGSTPGNQRTLADIADTAGTFLITEGGEINNLGTENYNPMKWVEGNPADWQVYPPSSWTGTPYYTNTTGDWMRRPIARHSEGLNIIYCDGHIKWSRLDRFLGVPQDGNDGWDYGSPNNSWDNK